jgi:hypothetical protein
MLPVAWHGADAQPWMAPPPWNTVFTVAKVGAIAPLSLDEPLGTHAAAVPPAPPEPAEPLPPPGTTPASSVPGQPASAEAQSTHAATAMIERQTFMVRNLVPTAFRL